MEFRRGTAARAPGDRVIARCGWPWRAYRARMGMEERRTSRNFGEFDRGAGDGERGFAGEGSSRCQDAGEAMGDYAVEFREERIFGFLSTAC